MYELTTIATFTYPHEAYVLKSKLESEGIYCFLKAELSIQSVNFWSNALGGVKLQVSEGDKEKALEIMNQKNDLAEDNEEWKNYKIDEDFISANSIKLICPYCNSHNVSKAKRPGWVFVLSILTFGFPLLFYKKYYHCFDCHKDFTYKDLKYDK